MKGKICIFGAGGLAKEVYWLAVEAGLKDQVECFLETDDIYTKRNVLGVVVMPLSYFDPERFSAVIAISHPASKEQIMRLFPENTDYTTLVHPTARISEWASLGKGNIICANVVITCDISLGDHVLIDRMVNVGHDTTIGDHSSLLPGAIIAGNNTIGKRVLIGAKVATREKLRITDDVLIGMGSVVVKDITEPGVYAGNPARKIQ